VSRELSSDRAPLATRIALPALGLLLLLALWWLATRGAGEAFGMASRFAPRAALESLGTLLRTPELARHVFVSLQRIAIGLAAALVVGIPLGLLVGISRHVARTTSAAFQFLRMISPLSLMPMAVMAFGVGDQPIYYLLSFVALWPVVLNTAAGVRALDARLLELAHSLSATRVELLWHVVVPGVLSHVLTGTRLAIGVLWIVLVPCEMLGVSAGLGYYVLDTRDRLAYSELMAMILVIGGLGYALDASARALCARLGVEES
jgi:NitT/TauT family transport system permease protein